MEAWLFSTDSYKDNFFLNIDGWRVGPGLGGGVGLIFVLGTGGKSPHAFQDLKVSGVDFQLNFGPRWGAIAKGLKGLKFVSKFARAGKIIEKGISLAEWEKLRDVILDLIKTGEINVHTEKPEIESFAIPLPHTGGGVEASVYYGWGRCFVHNVTLRN